MTKTKQGIDADEERQCLMVLMCAKEIEELDALILAGGEGRRLRPLLSDIPKPMAPVDNKPFLEYLLLFLKNSGIRSVILCVGYLAEKIVNHFGDGAKFGLQIRYSLENEPLGTGGALKAAQKLVASNPFLVLNGDSFLTFSLRDMVDYYFRKKAEHLIALSQVGDNERFGGVCLNDENLVLSFREKERNKGLSSTYANAGVYLLSQRIFDAIPPNRNVSIEREVFPRLGGTRFYGYKGSLRFIDIGTPDSYKYLSENSKILEFDDK